MSRRDDYVAAVRAGRSADVGAANPYAGQGMLADLWRSGYLEMLKRRVAGGSGQMETPRP